MSQRRSLAAGERGRVSVERSGTRRHSSHRAQPRLGCSIPLGPAPCTLASPTPALTLFSKPSLWTAFGLQDAAVIHEHEPHPQSIYRQRSRRTLLHLALGLHLSLQLLADDLPSHGACPISHAGATCSSPPSWFVARPLLGQKPLAGALCRRVADEGDQDLATTPAAMIGYHLAASVG